MLTLLSFALGMFIGWNFPQPEYVKQLQFWVIAKWKELTTK
jgi:hypothetical protein